MKFPAIARIVHTPHPAPRTPHPVAGVRKPANDRVGQEVCAGVS
ncbi:hypothetical protein ABZV80_27905 [Streptomyces sp. NPDC005132]